MLLVTFATYAATGLITRATLPLLATGDSGYVGAATARRPAVPLASARRGSSPRVLGLLTLSGAAMLVAEFAGSWQGVG